MTEPKPLITVNEELTDLKNGIAVINVNTDMLRDPDVSFNVSTQIKQAQQNFQQQAPLGAKYALVIDMSSVKHMSSVGFLALLSAKKELPSGNSAHVVGLTPELHSDFIKCRLQDTFHPTTATALDAIEDIKVAPHALAR